MYPYDSWWEVGDEGGLKKGAVASAGSNQERFLEEVHSRGLD